MARQLRIEYEGACYHVMSRGNGGNSIFADDADRMVCLDTLWECCERTGWIVHAYVLMGNHYHILLETPEANLVDGMKWFQGVYTQRYNRRHERRGHLYQGRYRALLVDDGESGYFTAASSYIHLNPVRAGLLDPDFKRVETYCWCSSAFYLAPRSKRPKALSVERVLGALGWKDGGKGRKAYLDWLNGRALEECDPEAAQRLEDERNGLRRGWCFGSTDFRDRMVTLLEGSGTDNYRGVQRTDHGMMGARILLRSALDKLGATEKEIESLPGNAIEKQGIAWLLKKHTILTNKQISDFLDMGSRANIARAVRRFEDPADAKTKQLKKQMSRCTG